MKVRVIFDKDTEDKKLHTGWGVSFFIGERVLFDTGERGNWLLENMRYLNIDINAIESVVISHDHWDHTGGLWELLKEKGGFAVYACSGFSGEFRQKVESLKGRIIEAERFTEIADNVLTTGEITGEYKGRYIAEQALVVKTEKGLTIITGCSHPGIIKIVQNVKDHFAGEVINLVFGGFHLMDKDKRTIKFIVESFRKMQVIKAGPTHCSGYAAQDIFRNAYGDSFTAIKTGQVLEI